MTARSSSTRGGDDDSLTRLFERVTGDDDSRMCRDISDAACREQPGNFFRHLVAALGNKLADELSNARLILPWLMGAIGAPVWMVGLLVPIREAGALLPATADRGLYPTAQDSQMGVGGRWRGPGGGRSAPGPAGAVRPR